jgi:hypothetical protein
MWTQRTAKLTTALAGAIVLAFFASMTPSSAQPAPGGPGFWGPGIMGPGMMSRWMGRRGFMCDPRVAGFAEWRIDRIERAIQPNEAQRKALDELRVASTKAGEAMRAACPTELPATAPARLEAMEKRMEAMLQAIKAVRPAFDAFYATLDDKQKARLSEAGPRGWGWRWTR